MGKKIAIINFKDSEGPLLAKALSIVTGSQLVQNRNMYEWRKLFSIDEKKMDIWDNQFLTMSSSFIKRIKSEFQNSDFISNGAAFSEVLLLMSRVNDKSIEFNHEELGMLYSMLNISGRYASEHYDLVIHIRSIDCISLDELSINFYDKHHISYQLFDCGINLKEILVNIIREVELPMIQLLDNAIYEADRSVNFKNWKS